MVRGRADRTGFGSQPQGPARKRSHLLGELQPHFEPERLQSSTELLWSTDFTKLLTFLPLGRREDVFYVFCGVFTVAWL